MKITQVRNATLRVEYAGMRFLIDPMLAEKGAYPAFPETPNAELRNPLVGLPLSMEEIVDVDAVIVTHTHPDHWDEGAAKHIPKEMPIYVQHQQDADFISGMGFQNVSIFADATDIGGVVLHKTGGQHGAPDAFANEQMTGLLGSVSGVVLKNEKEKTLYIAGDTVWNGTVHDVLKTHSPEVVVVNGGEAYMSACGAITMGKADILNLHHAKPDAIIFVTHMEAVNHCILKRPNLRAFTTFHGFADRVHIPQDGETVTL